MEAGKVATELRRIADALDKGPELDLDPYFSIGVRGDDKTTFLALAKIMPRPMVKGIDFTGTSYEDFKLEHDFWRIKIARKSMCVLVEPARPARYECPTILSEEEEDALGAF
jgi:hypothetical protein